MRLLPLGLLCLLLLAPSAGAAPTTLGRLEAASLSLQGEGTAQGLLTVLHSAPREGADLDNEADGAPGVFSFSAQRLLVGTDHVVSNASTAVIASPGYKYSDEAQFGAAQVESGRDGPLAYFFLMPLPGAEPPTIHVAGALLSLSPAENGVREQRRYTSSQGGLLAPVGDALRGLTGHEERPMLATRSLDDVRAAGSAREVVVRGDFAMTLWDWDVTVRSGENVTVFQSGEEQTPTDYGIPAQVGGQRTVDKIHNRQIYLEVHGAEFVMEVQRPLDVALELSTLEVRTLGFLQFQDAEGDVLGDDGPRAVAAPRMDVRGDVAAVLRGVQGGRMDLELRGERAEVDLGEQSFVVAPPPSPLRWAAWAALALLAVALAWGGRALWLHRRHRAFEAAASEDRHEDAVRLAKPLLRSRRHGSATAVACAISLLKAGQPDEALRLLGEGVRPRVTEPGVRDYLLAHAYGLKDDWGQARAHLTRSLELAPGIRALVLQNRLLVHLLGEWSDECDVA